jgi:hypothetical protein
MTERPEFVLGHDPMGGRPNIRAEIKRLRRDPLGELVERLGGHKPTVLSNPAGLYQEAYAFYFLSLYRYLREMSVAARYSRGPYWVRRSRGKYTAIQRKLADEFNVIAPFLELDLINCLLHSRILLDRVVGLSFLPSRCWRASDLQSATAQLRYPGFERDASRFSRKPRAPAGSNV